MIKVWDNHNKQWLNPTAIMFDNDGQVCRVSAMEQNHTDPIRDGWWTFEEKDMDKIAVVGGIDHNLKLLPNIINKPKKRKSKKRT